MSFLNVAHALWADPWVVLRETHEQMSRILQEHIAGVAHDPGGCAEVWEKLKARERELNEQRLEASAYHENGRVAREPFGRAASNVEVAVIPVHGVIGKRVGYFDKMSGVTDIDDLLFALEAAENADDVTGILLDVDSPGGAVTGTPEAGVAIAAASDAKPIVAFTDTIMASGAYWLSAGCSAIVASQSAKVGSIGVYMAWLDVSRQFDKEGITTELIKHGKFKAMGISGTSLTDEQRALLQADVDKIYGWFSGAVVEYRGAVPDGTMEGQCFGAEEAMAANLVDDVGGRDVAMAQLERLTNEG